MRIAASIMMRPERHKFRLTEKGECRIGIANDFILGGVLFKGDTPHAM